MTAYNNILYPSYSHPQTHPDTLAVAGTLFGLKPAAITRCRVLELGCGNGSNLVPMAWSLPGSEFTGIDLAEVPVQMGQEMAADLGLKNVRLVAGDVMQIDRSWGEFDYIIAHGLYSWVPEPVREGVMQICQRNLAPQGIAFISYNALPGCHLRQMLREMMLFHVRQVSDPKERLQQALALLSFLREAHLSGQDEYAMWLGKELERAQAMDEAHLFHDDLASENRPFYFHEFMGRAGRQGLQFVGEADFFEMSDHLFAPNIREVLKGTAHDRILREQYLDFLKCRRFRQTLLCHAGAPISPEPVPGAVTKFYISSKATQREQPGEKSAGYATRKGTRIQTDYPAGQEILKVLAELSPGEIHFAELLEKVRTRLKTEQGTSPEQVCTFLLQLYGAGVVAFKTQPVAKARRAGEFPVSSPVARWQIERGSTVTSLDHQILQVEDEIGKTLVRKLDGTRDRKLLVEELLEVLRARQALAPGPEAEARAKLERELEENLGKIADLGLLVA